MRALLPCLGFRGWGRGAFALLASFRVCGSRLLAGVNSTAKEYTLRYGKSFVGKSIFNVVQFGCELGFRCSWGLLESGDRRLRAREIVHNGGMGLFIGVDLVHVPGFGEQLRIPGSKFEATVFTEAEIAYADGKPSQIQRDAHLSGRWAAKEAFVKAWSQSMYGSPPPITPGTLNWQEIEVVHDRWGRVAISLHGEVAKNAADINTQVSISHDGDYATATVLVSRDTE